MSAALRNCGRDIVYSLSNTASFDLAPDYARLANLWRTTGDITDTWDSVSGIGFSHDRWTPYAGPGHWNDPDMLVIGRIGWGDLRPTRLTPDEQYTHLTLWCLLSAPLLLGCDLTELDDFTLNLLTNDEVLAVNQDSLGRPAVPIRRQNGHEIWAKPLAGDSWAIGLFNRTDTPADITLPLTDLSLPSPQPIRDLWRQHNITDAGDHLTCQVAPHSAELIRIAGSP
jgi:alpha-galactosidase